LPQRTALAAATVAAALLAVPALASAPPVGPLPPGPVTAVSTHKGELLAVALPRQAASTGLVWRLARPVNQKVARQISEADVGASVVIVYRLVGKGQASIVYAATKGETAKAYKARTYKVRAA
jgi:hypothetical protein